mmetsp:Transcript_3144/g.5542  ORF Transcript_3144/g.5542 Transcript_3144/m.5542 type:complete len:273 (-) Transcript_3144:152-970(-)
MSGASIVNRSSSAAPMPRKAPECPRLQCSANAARGPCPNTRQCMSGVFLVSNAMVPKVSLQFTRQMRVQIIQPILSPEPRPIIGHIKRRAKGPRFHRLIQIAGISLRPHQQPTVRQRRIKPSLHQTRADHIILRNVLLLSPARPCEPMRQRAQIPTAGIGRRDESIRRWRHIGRPMRWLQIELHPQLLSLPHQFLRAVFLTADVAVFGWRAPRAAKQRHNIKRLIDNLSPVFGRNRLQPGACKIGIRRNCREIIGDRGHLCLPDGALSFARR